MPSLYDELGVGPGADLDELRRAYRRRARELHPDVNPDLNDTAEAGAAMRRLNQAWTILGDPAARVRYDEELRRPRQAPVPAAPMPPETPDPPPPAPAAAGWLRLVRPSVIIPVVLFLIFVATAYAAHPGGSTTVPKVTQTTPADATTTPALNLVGSCIRPEPGAVQLVPCSQRPNSLVLAAVPAAGTCPVGTTGYLLAGQADLLCAAPSS